jgi:hypothetical protein
VANVFHTVPQLSKYGSGVSTHAQHQRLDASGRHAQRGHRIPLRPSSISSDWSVTTESRGRVSFRSCSDMTVEPGMRSSYYWSVGACASG